MSLVQKRLQNKRLSSSCRVKFWDYGKHMMHAAILGPLACFFHYGQKWNQIQLCIQCDAFSLHKQWILKNLSEGELSWACAQLKWNIPIYFLLVIWWILLNEVTVYFTLISTSDELLSEREFTFNISFFNMLLFYLTNTSYFKRRY